MPDGDLAGGLMLVSGAALGSCLGSYFAALCDRLSRRVPANDPPRSECPGCHRQLSWHDNIPILSYALLRGRCRTCGWRIPFWYLGWEVAGLVVGLAAVVAGCGFLS